MSKAIETIKEMKAIWQKENYTKEEKQKISDFLYNIIWIDSSTFVLFVFSFFPALIIWAFSNFSITWIVYVFIMFLIWFFLNNKIKKQENSIIDLFKSIIEYYWYNSDLYINIILWKEKYWNISMTLEDVSINQKKVNDLFFNLVWKKIRKSNLSNEYLMENIVKEDFLKKSNQSMKDKERKRLEEEIKKMDQIKLERNQKTKNIITLLEKAEYDTMKIKENIYN